MRKFMLGAALASFVALGGCTSTGGLNTALIAQDAQAVCNFVPTADSIAAVLTANPLVGTAEDVAAIICAAVTSTTPAASAKLRATAPGTTISKTVTINGQSVTITGTFQ